MIARQLQKSFEFALNEALKRRHEYVTLEHLLYALLHDRDVRECIRACGGDVDILRKQLDDFMNRTLEQLPDDAEVQPVLTAMLQRIVQYAQLHRIHFEFIEGWCVAAHSDTWKQLGGWNERSFPMPYCEDAELSFRASRIGIQLIETKWGIAHKGGGTSQSVPSVNLAYDRNAATLDAILRGVPVSNQDQTPAGVTRPSPIRHGTGLEHDRGR